MTNRTGASDDKSRQIRFRADRSACFRSPCVLGPVTSLQAFVDAKLASTTFKSTALRLTVRGCNKNVPIQSLHDS